MASRTKSARDFARQLCAISLADGTVSAERVTGVLDYVQRHRPANPVLVLKAYRRLIAAEIARSQAVVEHAGAVSNPALQAISAGLSKKYGRTIPAVAQPNPALIAGLRVRVGDDVYESSIAGQLSALAASV